MADEKLTKKYAADLAAEILTSYLSNSQVSVKPDEVVPLYEQLFNKISANGNDIDSVDNTNNSYMATKVSQADSVTPEYLICMECGKKLSILKRHLIREHKLTEFEYRDKYNLPASYPMVSQKYSEKRSEIAKKSHFGDVWKKGK